MSFLHPNYLWFSLLLLPYLLFIYFYYRKQLEVLRLLYRYNLNAKMQRTYQRYFSTLATCFALLPLFLILALAKPLWGVNNQVDPQTKDLQIVFALDISRSMLAKDVQPSRLNRAVKLIGELYETFQGHELGLVVFKGRAQTLIPLSRDRLVFPTLFPQLNTDILQTPGSNMASAVQEAMKLFDNKRNANHVIIMLSDGETLSGKIEQLELESWDGTIMTIGVGTPDGAEIKDQYGEIITDNYGLPVRSRLQSKALINLSRRSFGRYYRIQTLNLTQKIQDELSPLVRGKYILKYNLRDRYQIFIVLALLCFLILAVLKRFGFTGFYQFTQNQNLPLFFDTTQSSENAKPNTKLGKHPDAKL